MEAKFYPYAQKIYNNIWVGDVNSCKDTSFLRKNNIQIIINCTDDIDNFYEPYLLKPIENPEEYFIQYHRIPVKDNNKKEEIDKFTYYAKELVGKIDISKNILIHCSAGVQRSSALMVYFLYEKFHFTFENAVKTLLKKRMGAFGYNGHTYRINFIDSLEELQKK
jgi:protein-tyrosine phosphatase